MRRPPASALALGLLAAALGCSSQPPLPGPDVVARLAGDEVRYVDFEAFLRANVGEAGGALASEALSNLFDRFLTEAALTRLAVDRGAVPAATEAREAIEALLAAEPAGAPAEAEVAAWYAAHAAEFRRPERVELRQILTEERLLAERARRELKVGQPFADVLARLGDGAVAPASGDQGVLARDELPAAFAGIVFKLRDGEVSDVVPAEYGFHVFQVVRHLPAETLPLDAVREEIRARLVGERADAVFARLVAEARSRYAVEVFDRNLPFNYRGTFPVERPYENR